MNVRFAFLIVVCLVLYSYILGAVQAIDSPLGVLKQMIRLFIIDPAPKNAQGNPIPHRVKLMSSYAMRRACLGVHLNR